MKRGLLSILLVILIANILFVSANYTIGNKSYEVQNTYGPGQDFQGWINLSIVNEDIGLILTDSLNNKVSLINLLQGDILLKEGTDYICNPAGCGSSFSAVNNQNAKTFTLNRNERKILGFKFNGIIEKIDDVEFNITSDAGADCSNQLEIDLFADDEIDSGNTKISYATCPNLRTNGCFNSSKSSSLVLMPGHGNMYCQRMRLSESPGFKLGAYLQIESGAEKTKMAIYDSDLITKLDECELNNSVFTGEVYCDSDLLVTKAADYYVCIYNNQGADTKTKIKSYVDPSGCGFYTTGYAQTENAAYSIFVEGKKFDSVGTLNITEDSPIDGLSDEIDTYIFQKYGSECPLAGCIVPIIFISNKDQTITVNGISIDYSSSYGPNEIIEIYDLVLSSAKVSTNGSKKISLNSAGFSLPNALGSLPYSVLIGTQQIFIADIFIAPVPEIKSISPMTAFTLFPMNFLVNVQELPNATISSYEWQFGNAAPSTTTTNRFENKVFQEVGPTPLKVTVTDINGKKNSRTFTINVGNYQALFLPKLTEAKGNVANVSAKIELLPPIYQEVIKKVLDYEELTRKLSAIELAHGTASTDNEYAKLVNDFLILDIPVSIIEKANTDYVSFYPNKNDVNPNVIKEFLGGTFPAQDEPQYMSASVDWSLINVNSQIKYRRIDANFDGRSEPILNVFELKVRQTGNTDAPGSIFIKQLENMQFDKTYGESVKAGYIQIPIGTAEKTITFLTTQDIGLIDVPIFFSPALASLPVINFEETDVQGIRWALFVVIIIFLILVGLVVYIFLQNWYKTKYETYLFKNRNYLFNLIHYIDAQKNKGVRESEIFGKLKKQGWNSEQINYVMRKYLGKRTGMFEIPVEKILNWFRKEPSPVTPVRQGIAPSRPPFRPNMGQPRRGFPSK
jgi:PKD repeat protein